MNKTSYHIILLLCLLTCNDLFAQRHKKKTYSMHDSLDHAIDFSDFIINANGFVPIPFIITEPALGGFGGAIIPVFMKKRQPIIDSVNGKIVMSPVAPDITGAAGMYSANNSWMIGGGRAGTFIKSRIKYYAMVGYGDINMSYYRTVGSAGEKKFTFNFKVIPATVQMIKRLGHSNWYAGLNYFFISTKLKPEGDSLPSFVSGKNIKSIVSQAGVVVEFDNRDNIFTPDRGLKFHVNVNRSDNIFGSDYDFWRINYYTYLYKTIAPGLTGGLRIDGQQVFNDPPFYMLPYIDMRGVAAERYQGNADLLTELECRWDFTRRWSVLLFGGTGTAFDEWKDIGDSQWIFSYGSGIRYLLARKFKLRVGVDVAKGPDAWAYYIVFGSNWLK